MTAMHTPSQPNPTESLSRRRERFRPSVFFLISASLTLFVIVLSIVELRIIERFDTGMYDLNVVNRKQQTVHPDIAIVTVDERSLDTEGRWPWPRSRMASLVHILSEAGADVIGFDVGFLEAEKEPFRQIIAELQKQIDGTDNPVSGLAALIGTLALNNSNDTRFADAIQASGAAVVLGYFFHMKETGGGEAETEPAGSEKEPGILGSRYPVVRFDNAAADNHWFFNASLAEENLAVLNKATPYSGYFNIAANQDGVVRTLPLVIRYRENYFPPLSLVTAWLYLDRPELEIVVDELGISRIAMGDRIIPTDERGRMLINFPGPSGTFPSYSAADVLSLNIPSGAFAGRIVLVGVTAKGLNDNKTVPFGPDYPGVEIHAAALNTMLTGHFLVKPRWQAALVFFCIILMGLIMGFAIPRLSALQGLMFALFFSAVIIVSARTVFLVWGMWIGPVYPLIAIAVTYTGLTACRYFLETRERLRVKRMFGRYTSPELVEEITRQPSKLVLGGEVKTITVLFIDLANFTTISESRTPQEVLGIMSRYFKDMTEFVFDHKGTLKEYVGDELMAIFGAPLQQDDHAARACRAALAMQAHLAFVRENPDRTGLPPLNARAGINSGEMLVGNLGSEYRFSYGALGDNVNLGSRLEGLNKVYGTKIIIGQRTEALVRGQFIVRRLDAVRVKGRAQPENVYELIGAAGDAIHESHRFALACYEEGLRYYRDQEWDRAMELFRKGSTARPEDLSFDVMIERCRAYGLTPPGNDWDGVFEMKTK